VIFVDEQKRENVYNVVANQRLARLRASDQARRQNALRTPAGEEYWPCQFGMFIIREREVETV
jgi:hypothetical protein